MEIFLLVALALSLFTCGVLTLLLILSVRRQEIILESIEVALRKTKDEAWKT